MGPPYILLVFLHAASASSYGFSTEFENKQACNAALHQIVEQKQVQVQYIACVPKRY